MSYMNIFAHSSPFLSISSQLSPISPIFPCFPYSFHFSMALRLVGQCCRS